MSKPEDTKANKVSTSGNQDQASETAARQRSGASDSSQAGSDRTEDVAAAPYPPGADAPKPARPKLAVTEDGRTPTEVSTGIVTTKEQYEADDKDPLTLLQEVRDSLYAQNLHLSNAKLVARIERQLVRAEGASKPGDPVANEHSPKTQALIDSTGPQDVKAIG